VPKFICVKCVKCGPEDDVMLFETCRVV